MSAALVWAGASILWKKLGEDVAPLGMNLGKGLISLLGFGLLFTAFSMPTAAPSAWFLLGLSGLIGISLGDTTYFMALLKLGPRRILVMTALGKDPHERLPKNLMQPSYTRAFHRVLKENWSVNAPWAAPWDARKNALGEASQNGPQKT